MRRHQGRQKVRNRETVDPPVRMLFTPNQCVIFFRLNEKGVSQRRLAETAGVSQSTMFRAIRRGMDSFLAYDIPRLEILFARYTREQGWHCTHEPIQLGDQVFCDHCCISGYDSVDAMQVTAKDRRELSGEPEPKEPEGPTSYAKKKFGGRKRSKKQ